MPEVRQRFQIKLRNRFSCFGGESTEGNEQEIETQWTNIKESYKKTTEEVLGYRKKSKVSPGYGLLAGRKSTKDLVKL